MCSWSPGLSRAGLKMERGSHGKAVSRASCVLVYNLSCRCCITSLLLYLLSLGVVFTQSKPTSSTQEGQLLLAGHGRAPSLGLTGPFLHIDPS